MSETAAILLVGPARHRETIATVIAAANRQFRYCGSAQSALAYLRAHRPELIIIGENVDPMLRVLIAISSRHRYPGLKIAAFLGDSEPSVSRNKVDEVLPLDGNAADLSTCLNRLLGICSADVVPGSDRSLFTRGY